jgi:hypothetical protein
MISMNASARGAASLRETNVDAKLAIAAVLRNWRRCIRLILSNEPVHWSKNSELATFVGYR